MINDNFLKYFLEAFARERKSLYLSVRQARSKLQGLEDDCPGASWLPVICQNPTVDVLTWEDLIGLGAKKQERARVYPPVNPKIWIKLNSDRDRFKKED